MIDSLKSLIHRLNSSFFFSLGEKYKPGIRVLLYVKEGMNEPVEEVTQTLLPSSLYMIQAQIASKEVFQI